MNLSKLNSKVQPYASALVERFPRFRRNLTVEKNGEFETFIWSPPGSNAGAMVCQSLLGNVWVRFAPGCTGCCCESVPDLLKTIRNLLSVKFAIAVVWNKKVWVETSLRAAGTRPVLRRGQTVEIYSWRGLNSRALKRRRNRETRKSNGVGGRTRRRKR
jgi:hypothetical protein